MSKHKGFKLKTVSSFPRKKCPPFLKHQVQPWRQQQQLWSLSSVDSSQGWKSLRKFCLKLLFATKSWVFWPKFQGITIKHPGLPSEKRSIYVSQPRDVIKLGCWENLHFIAKIPKKCFARKWHPWLVDVEDMENAYVFPAEAQYLILSYPWPRWMLFCSQIWRDLRHCESGSRFCRRFCLTFWDFASFHWRWHCGFFDSR